MPRQFPERAPRPPRPKAINAYLGDLQQRWAEGEHNGHRLFEGWRERGYPASLTLVHDAIRPWRKDGPPTGPLRLLPSSGRTTPLGKPVFLLFKEEGE